MRNTFPLLRRPIEAEPSNGAHAACRELRFCDEVAEKVSAGFAYGQAAGSGDRP